jgi:hypothetical protein
MMIKVDTVEKVSKIDSINDIVLIGVNSATKGKGIVSHGDKIIKYKSGVSKDVLIQKYFYFIPYREGILYYEDEGEPIFYTDFKIKLKFAKEGSSFNPLQQRTNKETVLITEMDDSFQQSFYLFSEQLDRQLLPKFSNLLLNDSFVCASKYKIELFSSSTLKICWDYQCDEGFQLDKRNKLFSDEDLVYLPLKGGILIALDTHSGEQKWKYQGDANFVSYGEKGDFIYVHTGDSIIIISKANGQVINVINYSDYDELNSFMSNGIIWCFEKLIVVRNSGTGEVVLFSRESFEVLGRAIVDKSGIGESKDRIQFIDNYLYILGTSNTVHIYSINNTEHSIA